MPDALLKLLVKDKPLYSGKVRERRETKPPRRNEVRADERQTSSGKLREAPTNANGWQLKQIRARCRVQTAYAATTHIPSTVFHSKSRCRANTGPAAKVRPVRAYFFFFGRTFDLVAGWQRICACAVPHFCVL